jgi:hypothetical protein
VLLQCHSASPLLVLPPNIKFNTSIVPATTRCVEPCSLALMHTFYFLSLVSFCLWFICRLFSFLCSLFYCRFSYIIFHSFNQFSYLMYHAFFLLFRSVVFYFINERGRFIFSMRGVLGGSVDLHGFVRSLRHLLYTHTHIILHYLICSFYLFSRVLSLLFCMHVSSSFVLINKQVR